MQAFYTLVGPTITRPVQDPLAVTHLENQLYMSPPYIIFVMMLQGCWED